MKQFLVMCLSLACVCYAHAQPIECVDDDQCSEGMFCEQHYCHECLRCEDLKRDHPIGESCIRSVFGCGLCLEGLVDERVSGTGACVSDGADGAGGGGLATYWWAIIVVMVMAFFAAVIAVTVYILRNPHILKIHTSTGMSVQTPSVQNGLPSAPQPPPPYNACYEPVRPSSPHDTWLSTIEETTSPLVKHAPSSRPGSARQSAGSQAANVWNNPAYVRGPHLPLDVESGAVEEPREPDSLVDDDNTMESPWTPADNTDNTNNTNNSLTPSENTFSGALSAAGVRRLEPEAPAQSLRRAGTRTDLPTPSKIVCVRQDTNNNRKQSGGGGEGSGSLPPPPSPPATSSLVINVLNVNTVQQLNDVAL